MQFTRKMKEKIWFTISSALILTMAFMHKPVFAKMMFDDNANAYDSIYERSYLLTYKINQGDTLWRIAQTYGVTVEALQETNHIKGNLIIAGQTLEIPQTLLLNYEERRFVKIIEGKQVASTVPKKAKAIKDQEKVQIVKDDRYWLAKIIEAEAGIEAIEGKIAVGAVVLNRVDDDWFPDTIKDVIFHELNGVYQFSPVGNGRMDKVEPSEQAYEAADRALAGEDPTEGALYFYNPKISKSTFFKKKELVASIGNHQFFQ